MYFDPKPGPKMIWRYLQPTIEHLEAFISDKIRSHVGFTINPLTTCSIDSDSWAASSSGYESKFAEEPSRAVLLRDIASKLLATAVSNVPLYFGGWPQDGCYYLDLSRLILSREEAVDFARANNQEAIFNLRTGETLFVSRRDPPDPLPLLCG